MDPRRSNLPRTPTIRTLPLVKRLLQDNPPTSSPPLQRNRLLPRTRLLRKYRRLVNRQLLRPGTPRLRRTLHNSSTTYLHHCCRRYIGRSTLKNRAGFAHYTPLHGKPPNNALLPFGTLRSSWPPRPRLRKRGPIRRKIRHAPRWLPRRPQSGLRRSRIRNSPLLIHSSTGSTVHPPIRHPNPQHLRRRNRRRGRVHRNLNRPPRTPNHPQEHHRHLHHHHRNRRQSNYPLLQRQIVRTHRLLRITKQPNRPRFRNKRPVRLLRRSTLQTKHPLRRHHRSRRLQRNRLR